MGLGKTILLLIAGAVLAGLNRLRSKKQHPERWPY